MFWTFDGKNCVSHKKKKRKKKQEQISHSAENESKYEDTLLLENNCIW